MASRTRRSRGDGGASHLRRIVFSRRPREAGAARYVGGGRDARALPGEWAVSYNGSLGANVAADGGSWFHKGANVAQR